MLGTALAGVCGLRFDRLAGGRGRLARHSSGWCCLLEAAEQRKPQSK